MGLFDTVGPITTGGSLDKFDPPQTRIENPEQGIHEAARKSTGLKLGWKTGLVLVVVGGVVAAWYFHLLPFLG